jgi:hypothetical protein
MAEQLNSSDTIQPEVTVEDVKRVLEVGKILMSALTPEELDQLREIMKSQALDHLLVMSLSSRTEVGNTSVT